MHGLSSTGKTKQVSIHWQRVIGKNKELNELLIHLSSTGLYLTQEILQKMEGMALMSADSPGANLFPDDALVQVCREL